ncbi:tetratricopeptide repeat protein 21B-like [Prorops nasuta]|uniref:tetratricopeptide repeat protein 21B-like n=1 Tax=Prorops nasuta TaxID=863751 RepID=UPI0034CD81DC
MEESEYIAVIMWLWRQFYHNVMLTTAKQACDSYPTSGYLRILLSISYVLNGKPHESIRECNNLINQENNILPALIVQSFAHKSALNSDHSSLTQVDQKIKDEHKNASPDEVSQSALVLLFFQKAKKAKEYIDKAFKADPVNINILIIKGWIELYLPKEEPYEETINYFDFALRENEKHFNALLGSATYKHYHEDYEGAIAIANPLIVRYPKMCLPLIEKMMNQLALKKWEQVLETANRILLIESSNIDAIKAIAFVEICRDGGSQDSLKNIQLFTRNLVYTEPKNIDLLITNIELFSRISGRNNAVLSELLRTTDKMLQNNPKNTELMVECGNLCIMLGKIKEAEHWYKNTVRIDESSYNALIGLALYQLLSGLPDAINLAKQQINFLLDAQAQAASAELLVMLAKLYRDDRIKSLHHLEEAAVLLQKDAENLPYGYEHLRKLNPDLTLEIVKERLIHPLTDKVLGELDKDPVMNLLQKVVAACPGLSSASLMLCKAKMEAGYLDEAKIILKKLLDSVDSNNAEAHLLMAQILARQEYYEQASQSLEVGLSHNFKIRDDPIYHLIVGIVQKKRGDIENCIHSFEIAMSFAGLKQNSDVREIQQMSISNKATLYLELISAQCKRKQFEEALSLIEDAKILFSGTAEEGKIIIGTGELYLEMGEIEKTIDHLSRILPGEPYYVLAHTKLADIYLSYRKDREAFAKCYRELVEHSPDFKTYNMLGDAYISIQEPDRAVEAYEEGLRQNPIDKISIAVKLGKALVKTHQYARAINYYKDMIKNHGCKALKLDLAKLFLKMKQYEKAESTLVKELQDSRGDTDLQCLENRTELLLLLAKVREKAENLKGALSTLKEAKENQIRLIQRLALVPDVMDQKEILAEICLTMADYASTLRDYDQAIMHYRDVLDHKPSDVKALLALAKLYMQMNHLEKCAQTCTVLLNADPDNEIASVMMADLAFRKIDFETAAFHFRQLLVRKPTYWTALARLIEVSRRTGDMDNLDEWIERAEAEMAGGNKEAGFFYCSGLLDWRTGKLNSALRNFNTARRDPEWGQQAIYNMIEICLDPDDDSTLSAEVFVDDDSDYQDARTMALKTALRLLQELNPKGNTHEMLTHRLLGNFFLLATKQKFNIEKALQDCTALGSQEVLRDHVGPALGMAMAHILLKQTPRARNHLKRVSKNTWTFEDAEYLERCWLLLADIYVQSSKYELANELLKKVLQHNATCVRAHVLSGQIAERDQNYREAAARYGQAWRFGGKSKHSVGYKYAYCCLKAKAYAESIEACDEILKQNPDYPRIKKDIMEKALSNLRT